MADTAKTSDQLLVEVIPLFEETVLAYFSERLSPIDRQRIHLSRTNGQRPTQDDIDLFHCAVVFTLSQALDDVAGVLARQRGCKWDASEN